MNFRFEFYRIYYNSLNNKLLYFSAIFIIIICNQLTFESIVIRRSVTYGECIVDVSFVSRNDHIVTFTIYNIRIHPDNNQMLLWHLFLFLASFGSPYTLCLGYRHKHTQIEYIRPFIACLRADFPPIIVFTKTITYTHKINDPMNRWDREREGAIDYSFMYACVQWMSACICDSNDWVGKKHRNKCNRNQDR